MFYLVWTKCKWKSCFLTQASPLRHVSEMVSADVGISTTVSPEWKGRYGTRVPLTMTKNFNQMSSQKYSSLFCWLCAMHRHGLPDKGEDSMPAVLNIRARHNKTLTPMTQMWSHLARARKMPVSYCERHAPFHFRLWAFHATRSTNKNGRNHSLVWYSSGTT